jgi:hypothetical protein
MSVTPLPAWSAYLILIAIGACSVGLVALGRAFESRAGDARRRRQMRG